MSALLVVKPGALSTIQDLGRPGLRRFGIPPSGAMDQFSYRIGNLLVGNHSGAASVEVTLQGFVVEAQGPTVVAITGGDFELEHGETALPDALSARCSTKPPPP